VVRRMLDCGCPTVATNNCLAWVKEGMEEEKRGIENAYNQDLYGGLSGNQKFDNGEDYFNQIYKS